jgi:hypothetical protein
MRLRTTCPVMPRAWTVELRSHASGLVLVCQQCPHAGGQVAAASARSAALAHLARHARGAFVPIHLRVCQCHERGCRWPPRHRCCDGPIRLLLACERGGRLWRLADACGACAAATAQAEPSCPSTAALSTTNRSTMSTGSGSKAAARVGTYLPCHTSAASCLRGQTRRGGRRRDGGARNGSGDYRGHGGSGGVPAAHRWIKARAEVRRAELEQQGLSERIRCLPPGSRLTEKSADREVDITVGGTHLAAGNQER